MGWTWDNILFSFSPDYWRCWWYRWTQKFHFSHSADGVLWLECEVFCSASHEGNPLCACFLHRGPAALERLGCRCPYVSLWLNLFPLLFSSVRGGKGMDFGELHGQPLPEVARRGSDRRDSNVLLGKEPRAKTLHLWNAFKNKCKNEERFCTWSRSASLAHLHYRVASF